MIVQKSSAQAVRLIRQRDHAVASGALAGYWKRPSEFDTQQWRRFTAAVARHDDGWGDDTQYAELCSDGMPCSFKEIDGEAHHKIWLSSVEQAANDDPYQGLLVALHARQLEIDTAEKDAGSQHFIGRLTQITAELIEVVRQETPLLVEPRNLDDARELLLFLDGLSLMLLGGIGWIGQSDDLPVSESRHRFNVTRIESGCNISPWPFTQDLIDLDVPAVDCPSDGFSNVDELRTHLRTGRQTNLHYRIEPA